TVLGSPEVDEGVRRPNHQVANELLRRYEQEEPCADFHVLKCFGERFLAVVSKLAEYVCDKDPEYSPVVYSWATADTSTATSVESCESALRLLKEREAAVISLEPWEDPRYFGQKPSVLGSSSECATRKSQTASKHLPHMRKMTLEKPFCAEAMCLGCDLRLDDNLALKAATEGAQSFLPIYVFDPEKFNTPTLAGARKSSARRARFLVESVQCLRHKLEQGGSGLAVALGPPQEVIPKLAESCASVTVTKGFCSEEQQEEHLVSKRLKAGAELRSVWGGTLYMPEECGQNPASTPLLFTSFKNKAEGRGHIRAPVSAPKQLPPVPNLGELKEALSFLPTLQQLGYENEEVEEALRDDPRGVLPFQGGEDAALARLQKWMFDDNHLKDYFDIRNGMLGEGFSSKLSPWLAKRYETERRIQNKSTYWLVFELTWRDFFIYMAWSQGDKIFLPGGITGDRTAWRGSKDKLQRWKEGTTGDQLVDANMRELKATGFMSNRGRQNVASFLIFDLGVDWRHGAAHFEELLLDYDPCSNWGNWVAAAGLTGQRINKFNTRKQLQDYDPHREYVNHWLRGDGRKVQTQTVLTFQPAREEGTNNGPEGKRGLSQNGRYQISTPRHEEILQVLTALAQAKEEDLLQECIQAFTDVATVEPDFFKAQLAQNLEPAKFMATVARTREACESGLRGLAIEWLVSYVEKRHKFLSKSAPDFINLTLECCLGLSVSAWRARAPASEPSQPDLVAGAPVLHGGMSLMLEVDDSEEKLKARESRESNKQMVMMEPHGCGSTPNRRNAQLLNCKVIKSRVFWAQRDGAAVRQPDAEVEDVPLDDDSTSEGGNSPPCRGDPMQSPEESEAPARVWASKGITGLLETVGGRRVEEEVLENSVLLNVYDVSDSDVIQRVNRIFTADDTVLAGGVFHAGVEVYGKEWCYGATVPGRSGVGAVKPRLHPQHRYRATVHMGNTEKSPDEISRILVCMASEWPGSAYDLIHHNCLTFCNVLLGELGLRRIPGWVDRAARAASQVDKAVKAVRSISADEVQLQAEETLQTLRRDSLAALEAAKGGTQKFLERVQEQAQQPLSEASELAGRAQEQLQSVGASIWQWGQSFQESVGMSEAAVPNLSDIGKKAEDNWQSFSDSLRSWGENVTKDLKQTLEGSKPGKAGAGAGGYRTETDRDERGTAGLIKAQEASLLKQGLLEDEDEGDSEHQAPTSFPTGAQQRDLLDDWDAAGLQSAV
ncbi:Cryptochrome DASH, partial [Durusdinium trenchii]